MGGLDGWRRCVVHLEAAADSVSADERHAEFRAMSERLRSAEHPDEVPLGPSGGSRDVRFRGTAIFLEHERRRYLVTARHVLHDRESAERDTVASRGPDDTYRQSTIDGWIFRMIFRIPSLDEVTQGDIPDRPAFLMNLGAGTSWGRPYTYSDPSLDLAIVSLDQRDGPFADELIANGYRPVGLVDIEERPSGEGAEIMSVGYPDAVAVLHDRELHPALEHWASPAVSLPVFSWGRVAMQHDHLPYFWADLTVYPGNSGGPVIEADKVVGIVSAQAMVDGVRVPFASVINAGHIRTLLATQVEQDAVH